jgi:hypothetical protein
MASSTEICNLALSHLGTGKRIADIETERSQEAATFRSLYDIVLDEVLRDYAWPFATKIDDLGLIEEDPNSEWSFSYRYPTDCVFFRKLLSGTRNETMNSLVPYKISNDDTGQIILTDLEDAEAEWTMRVSNSALFPADFTMAFSMKLAERASSTLLGGDPFSIGDKVASKYLRTVENAMAAAGNEEQKELKPESEFILARDS